MKTISSVAKRMYGLRPRQVSPAPSTSPTAAPAQTARPATSGSSGFGTKRAAVRSLLRMVRSRSALPSDWQAKWIRRIDPPADQNSPPSAGSGSPATTHRSPSPARTAEPATPAPRRSSHARKPAHRQSRSVRGDSVNGVVTGHHASWGAFDSEEIGPLLKTRRQRG